MLKFVDEGRVWLKYKDKQLQKYLKPYEIEQLWFKYLDQAKAACDYDEDIEFYQIYTAGIVKGLILAELEARKTLYKNLLVSLEEIRKKKVEHVD